jgi:hypothetical protein
MREIPEDSQKALKTINSTFKAKIDTASRENQSSHAVNSSTKQRSSIEKPPTWIETFCSYREDFRKHGSPTPELDTLIIIFHTEEKHFRKLSESTSLKALLHECSKKRFGVTNSGKNQNALAAVITALEKNWGKSIS